MARENQGKTWMNEEMDDDDDDVSKIVCRFSVSTKVNYSTMFFFPWMKSIFFAFDCDVPG